MLRLSLSGGGPASSSSHRSTGCRRWSLSALYSLNYYISLLLLSRRWQWPILSLSHKKRAVLQSRWQSLVSEFDPAFASEQHEVVFAHLIPDRAAYQHELQYLVKTFQLERFLTLLQHLAHIYHAALQQASHHECFPHLQHI